MAAQSPSNVRQQLRSVLQAQAKVAARITEIQNQLDKLEKSIPPPDKYVPEIGVCMSGDLRIWCVKYIKAPPPRLRESLRRELAGLQGKMRNLRRHEKGLAQRVKTRRQAHLRSNEFSKEAKKILQEGEKQGYVDAETIDELLKGSVKVLKNYVTILRSHASVENIKEVLKHLDTPLLLGGDTERGTCAEAFRALESASARLLEQAQADFSKVPSGGNFDRVLNRAVLSQQLGGATGFAIETRPARQHASGPGSGSNTTHTVAPGESLSSIAAFYYGEARHWPAIYMANFTNLDPRKLQVGATLNIP